MTARPLLFLLVFLPLLSCGKAEFVKKVPPPPEQTTQESYVLQKIVGSRADILWVVDNSASMSSYQRNLIDNMNRFIRSFSKTTSNADWKMGLLSTDLDDNPYVGFDSSSPLDFTSKDSIQRFNKAIARLGTSGDAIAEQSFGPIRKALTEYPDFLRPNSKLFIILVTDEKEQSGESTGEILSFLHSLRRPEDISTYGIFEKSEDGCGTTTYQDSIYQDFINQTKGLTFEICASDYGVGLAKFGNDIAQKIITPKIFLGAPPVPESIRVFYKDVELPGGSLEKGGYWRYSANENAIAFHNLNFFKGGQRSQEEVRVLFTKEEMVLP